METGGRSAFSGRPLIPQDAVRLTGRRKLNAYLESTSRYWRNDEVYPWESFFLVLPDYVPGEEALLNKTYFTTIPTDEQKKSGVEPHTIASRMRPALLKEVREAEAYRVRSRVRDRESRANRTIRPFQACTWWNRKPCFLMTAFIISSSRRLERPFRRAKSLRSGMRGWAKVANFPVPRIMARCQIRKVV